jgi:dihydroxyacetone kinase-like protein
LAAGLTTQALRAGLGRIAAQIEVSAEELNTIDGELGDGDLGVTMQRGVRGVMEGLADLPDDVGMALMKCAQAFVRVSASSFGTLLATGLMSAAKATKGRTEVPWSETSALIGGANEAMMRRGKGQLGEKTVLDALEAARLATDGLDDPQAILAAADAAVAGALDSFRDRLSKQGRARIWGDKSIGRDDPGMVALKRMIESLNAPDGLNTDGT